MTPFSPERVQAMIDAGEGRQLEFKEGVADDGRIARSICAFANTRGGVLLVGVADDGSLRGAPRPPATITGLRAIAADAVVPPVAVQVGTVAIAGKTVVWCSIPLSPARPHALASGAREVLVRVGSSNREARDSVTAAMGTPSTRRTAPTPFETTILDLLDQPGGPRTPAAVARALGAGRQRARRALERLERAGFLVAHGLGADRAYSRT